MSYQKAKLYNGKVTVMFDPKKHKYYVDGKPKSSVTTVLSIKAKPALVIWSANMAAEYFMEHYNPGDQLDEVDIVEMAEGMKNAHKVFTRKAASAGTVSHNFAQKFIENKLGLCEKPELPMNEMARNSSEAFLKWVKEHKIKFIATEAFTYSMKYQYIGLLDMDMEYEGHRCIGDIKTSKDFYETFYLQTAAYMQSRKEELGIKYKKRIIARIDKETAFFETRELNDFERDFNGFLACLNLYNFDKEYKKENGIYW